MILTVLA